MISILLFVLGFALGTYIGCRLSRNDHTDEEYTEAMRCWNVARNANGVNYNTIRKIAAALGMDEFEGCFSPKYSNEEIVQRVIDNREVINGIQRVLHQRKMLNSWYSKIEENS